MAVNVLICRPDSTSVYYAKSTKEHKYTKKARSKTARKNMAGKSNIKKF